MPRKLSLEGLTAELDAVTSLLQDAIRVEDPVGETQYKYRKEELEAEIKKLEGTPENLASVALFFGGEPVLGSRGIAAEFAGNVLEQFQELVSKTFAKEELGALGKRGPLPLKDSTRLMVTHITKGSFGFVLDELSDQTEIEATSLKIMVDEVAELLTNTVSPNESDFEKATELLDERTLVALKKFFITLDSSAATLRVVEGDRDITFDSSAIHLGRFRTEATIISEDDVYEAGELLGFLPEHKKFELRLASGEVIYGSVSNDAVQQFNSMAYRGEVVVGKKWQTRVQIRAITPLNRPPKKIYRLLGFIREIEGGTST